MGSKDGPLRCALSAHQQCPSPGHCFDDSVRILPQGSVGEEDGKEGVRGCEKYQRDCFTCAMQKCLRGMCLIGACSPYGALLHPVHLLVHVLGATEGEEYGRRLPRSSRGALGEQGTSESERAVS